MSWKLMHWSLIRRKRTWKKNQQLKNYDKKTVLRLLHYQKKHNLSANFMSKELLGLVELVLEELVNVLLKT